MTYKEWADEYKASADNIYAHIKSVKEEQKKAPIKDIPLYNDRLRILKDMYCDCMIVAKILRQRKGEV